MGRGRGNARVATSTTTISIAATTATSPSSESAPVAQTLAGKSEVAIDHHMPLGGTDAEFPRVRGNGGVLPCGSPGRSRSLSPRPVERRQHRLPRRAQANQRKVKRAGAEASLRAK